MIPRLVATIAIVLAVLVAAVVARLDQPSRVRIQAPAIPAPTQNSNRDTDACRDAIEKVYTSLDPESIDTLLATEKEDLIQFHHGWGTGIRNQLGLWQEDSPIRKSCAARTGARDMHPDHASSLIMEGVWLRAHADRDAEGAQCCLRSGL